MLQSQESANLKRISRQIRTRKESEENAVIEPFRSHRKRKEQCEVLMPLNPMDENKPQQFSKTKMNYAYTSFNATETKRPERFKYNFNQLTQSIANEDIFPTPTPINSQSVTNKFSSGIKKDTIFDYPLVIGSQIQRNQVKSIIFDSKVQPFVSRYSTPSVEDIEQQNDMEINSFKEKVQKVNNEIEEGINNLEKKIEMLKQKKISESLLKSKAIQPRFQNELNKGEETNKAQATELLVKEGGKQEVQNQSQNAFDFTLKKEVKRQPKPQFKPSSSQMQLTGQFKSKLGKFPPQYTTFINRLAQQIHIDMQFTNMISELNRSNQLPKLRSIIFNQLKNQPQVKIDESFFAIEPAQMDPLEISKPYFIITKPKDEEENELAMKICTKYQQIQTHFDTKLYKRSDSSIIKLLFEELAKFNSTKKTEQVKTVTVGHLLSYLNMRTNKSFRNRFFVKLSKRLSLKPGSNLSIQSFSLLTNEL